MRRFATLSLALLAGCNNPVGPDYEGAPAVEHAPSFFGSRRESSKPPELDRWWKRLGDRELDRLVAKALSANHDIAIAATRLREARAMRKGAASALLPQAGINTSFTRIDYGGLLGNEALAPIAGAGFFENPLDYWSGGVDIAWEIDVFGGRRREVRGAAAREQANAEMLRGTRLAVAAEVVETYFTIATLREQQQRVRAQVELQEKQADDMRERLRAGATSKLDLDRALARLETTRAALPELDAGIVGQQRRLALLLGQQPRAVDSKGIGSDPLPSKLPMVRVGVPAELVLRRPDVRAAERELAAATEDIGVAVAAFYPKFRIAGGPSGFGTSFANLFDATNIYWQYGPSVEWSPFTAGANRAVLEGANARQRGAMLSYEKAALAAIAEVETELASLRAETERLAIVQRAKAATASAAKRVRENYEAGATDFIEVLLEDELLREAEIAEIRAKSQLLQVWIRLHKALGGGLE